MFHISTRGEALPSGFMQTMLNGLAPDGGLYLPQNWPALSEKTIKGLVGKTYQETACLVLKALIEDEISEEELGDMVESAYSSFRHQAVCPLSQIDSNLFLLELYHGPTLAFKDLAMQLLGKLMDYALKKKGERATIVGATSGDTGSAAIEAFRGLEQVDIFILYPHGRVSDVQRRQMTTVKAANVHAIAVNGTFDDCQNILKALFNDAAFRREMNLSGVNSINWARVAAQTVYYFSSALSLGAPDRPVSFAVPTGNFGDVLAGWVAKKMGLPIECLIIGVNENDILARMYKSGDYALKHVVPTTSPSMDIQISSNFERLLFENYDRDAAAVNRLMTDLADRRSFTVSADALQRIRNEFFIAGVTEEQVQTEMQQIYQKNDFLIDPHTAIGLNVARQWSKEHPRIPVISLATAHPAKFPEAVHAATGQYPQLPKHMEPILHKTEQLTILENSKADIAAFIRETARSS